MFWDDIRNFHFPLLEEQSILKFPPLQKGVRGISHFHLFDKNKVSIFPPLQKGVRGIFLSKCSLRFNLSLILLFLSFFVQNNKSFAQDSSSNKFQYYMERYRVMDVSGKITDNHGDGFATLYGTRNMRPILHGVAYRGGANNAYHKNKARDNKNPLPEDGLKNLADEGFSAAVYLYSKNFDTCKTKIVTKNGKDTLRYLDKPTLDKKEMREIMEMVQEVIRNPKKGPIYFHCWNGWHQSGYVSAAILKQFCGYDDSTAVKYWLSNTDGASKGYEHIIKRIKEFKPFKDIKIDSTTQKRICPCMKE